MNHNTRPTYETTGILRIHGQDYHIDTYYPCGKAKPNYKMFHVWASTESHTFASEEGFERWLEKAQAPRQQALC